MLCHAATKVVKHLVYHYISEKHSPDSKVHGVNTGPTWALSAQSGAHIGPMNLYIRVISTTLGSHTLLVMFRTWLKFGGISVWNFFADFVCRFSDLFFCGQIFYVRNGWSIWHASIRCWANYVDSTFDLIMILSLDLQGQILKKLSPKWEVRLINSLWPSDAIWRKGSRSTLVQVMACCLTAPSHYLNQCWLIISKIQLQSSDGNFTRDTSVISD